VRLDGQRRGHGQHLRGGGEAGGRRAVTRQRRERERAHSAFQNVRFRAAVVWRVGQSAR
jgi:hypothetical protein